MKKIISVMESLPEKALAPELRQALLESQVDNHTCPWIIPEACYNLENRKLCEVKHMQEEVVERVRKERDEEQWDEFHKAQANGEVSQKQKRYIFVLAKSVGLKIDVSKITDRQQAHLLIERLKLLDKQMNNGEGKKTFDAELRDRKVAFGLATKLLFRRYAENEKAMMAKQFWSDVHRFYRAYEEQQKVAVKGGVAA